MTEQPMDLDTLAAIVARTHARLIDATVAAKQAAAARKDAAEAHAQAVAEWVAAREASAA